ncbi:transposase, partial [Streptococcus thermophilus]
VFRTFLRHKQYIKNALETDYSNAKLEATNKLIKDIKRLGFGLETLDVSFSSPTTVDKEPEIQKVVVN